MAYLGEEIKKLGFGLMRLPQKSEGVIDVEQTKVMVDKFMEAGFTYFDTAWAYAGSEDAIREALVERYPREKYQLATKMAAWINCKTRDEALAQFKTSLERTKAGYFDFYLLHNLGEHRTKYFDEYGLWDWIREQKEAGLIRHAGFSIPHRRSWMHFSLHIRKWNLYSCRSITQTGKIRRSSQEPATRWPENMENRSLSWNL